MNSVSSRWKLPLGCLALALFCAAAEVARTEDAKPEDAGGVTLIEGRSVVEPPPFSEDIFPCSDCHGPGEADKERRELTFHEEIVFEHDAENRWCLDCHDADNRDYLHYADGRLIPYTESYKLCGQCHAPQLKSWRAGDHGRRTGSWSGDKVYLLCAHCHNPHSPAIKPIEPMPPPLRQEQIR